MNRRTLINTDTSFYSEIESFVSTKWGYIETVFSFENENVLQRSDVISTVTRIPVTQIMVTILGEFMAT